MTKDIVLLTASWASVRLVACESAAKCVQSSWRLHVARMTGRQRRAELWRLRARMRGRRSKDVTPPPLPPPGPPADAHAPTPRASAGAAPEQQARPRSSEDPWSWAFNMTLPAPDLTAAHPSNPQ